MAALNCVRWLPLAKKLLNLVLMHAPCQRQLAVWHMPTPLPDTQ